jgi:hypothetical protein
MRRPELGVVYTRVEGGSGARELSLQERKGCAMVGSLKE